jgi:Zn-dependent protease with chaperone function
MMSSRLHSMSWSVGPFHGYCDNPLVCLLLAVAAAGLVLALGFFVAAIRSGWLGLAAYREVGRLPRTGWPVQLTASSPAGRIPRLVCLDLADPVAFCTGLLRPTVFISAGAVSALTPEQLDGVLLHEADHAHRYEPRRRTLRQSLSLSFFFVPLVRWWARYQAERAELRADRRALAAVGPKAVAGALLATQWQPGAGLVTAFSGAPQARVAQILGDPVPARRPSTWIVVLSIAGFAGAVWLTHCLAGGML